MSFHNQFLSEERIKKLKEVEKTLRQIKSEITSDHEEFFCIDSAIDSVKQAIKYQRIY